MINHQTPSAQITKWCNFVLLCPVRLYRIPDISTLCSLLMSNVSSLEASIAKVPVAADVRECQPFAIQTHKNIFRSTTPKRAPELEAHSIWKIPYYLVSALTLRPQTFFAIPFTNLPSGVKLNSASHPLTQPSSSAFAANGGQSNHG